MQHGLRQSRLVAAMVVESITTLGRLMAELELRVAG